jgi:hypothetical protein
MGKESVLQIRAKAQPSETTPLRDVTVTWARGLPGEKRFTGADIARLVEFAIAHGGAKQATSPDQSGHVKALGAVLGALNSSDHALDDGSCGS